MGMNQWDLGKSLGTGNLQGHLAERTQLTVGAEGANSHGWTKHQGNKSKVRVSIHESSKSGKLGGQVDRSMKLQAGREARLPADSRKGGGRNLARVAQTNIR